LGWIKEGDSAEDVEKKIRDQFHPHGLDDEKYER